MIFNLKQYRAAKSKVRGERVQISQRIGRNAIGDVVGVFPDKIVLLSIINGEQITVKLYDDVEIRIIG